jgi:hypothetical protein
VPIPAYRLRLRSLSYGGQVAQAGYLLAVFGCPAPITSFLFLRYQPHGFKIGAETLDRHGMIVII